jgi:hypothetical protein
VEPEPIWADGEAENMVPLPEFETCTILQLAWSLFLFGIFLK